MSNPQTTNGAAQYAASPITMLFFNIGSAAVNIDHLIGLFYAALAQDAELALRILLWSYDCRGGAGRRDNFLHLFTFAVADGRISTPVAERILEKIPELGRWDMLCYIAENLSTMPISGKAIHMIAAALKKGDRLCAKWMPRKGKMAARIRGALKLTPKQYRKLLVAATDVVETKMSANEWDAVEFSKVPSVAMTRYNSAFSRHCECAYNKYIEDVNAGKSSMNIAKAYPHDVVRAVFSARTKAETKAADTMWTQLPTITAVNTNILCMADVSGSMEIRVSGCISARDIALGLAVYFSQRMTGKFKDKLMAFSEHPRLFSISGLTLSKALERIAAHCPYPYNTDFNAAYMQLLEWADALGCTQEDMPDTLLVLSDMQFDSCGPAPHYEVLQKEFESRGLRMPRLIFWNLVGYYNGVPAQETEDGALMMSGYNPLMLNCIIGHVPIEEGIRNAVASDRYAL